MSILDGSLVPVPNFEDLDIVARVLFRHEIANRVDLGVVIKLERRAVDQNASVIGTGDVARRDIPAGDIAARIALDKDTGKEGRHEIAPFLVGEDAVLHVVVAGDLQTA